MPEAADYVTKHLYEQAFNWNTYHLTFESDPEHVLEWLRNNPEENEKSKCFRRAAEQYQALFPKDFERYFPGSLAPLEDKEGQNVTDTFDFSLPTNSVPLVLSPIPTYPSGSPARVAYHDYRYSTNYCYPLGFDLEADGVVRDIATKHIVITRQRWSDFPGASNFIVDESS